MILDFSNIPETTFEADLCIVGSGIACYGILSELANSNLDILILERGELNYTNTDTADNACIISGHGFNGHRDGRYLGFGGTSNTWGGQSLPLYSYDMEPKSWVPFSGWPIRRSDLDEYYPEAEKLLSLDPVPYETALHEIQKLESLSFSSKIFKTHFSKWSPNPNFSRQLQNLCEKSKSVRVLLNAQAFRIACKDETIQYIEFYGSKKRTGKIIARQFILAAGGLENARIMLCSDSLPKLPVLGKMFQDHPSAQVGTVEAKNDKLLQRYFNYFFINKTRILPRLSLAEDFQKEKQLPASTAFIQFIPSDKSSFNHLKEIYRDIQRGRFKRVDFITHFFSALKQGSLLKSLLDFLLHRRIYTPGSVARLTIMVEREPDVDILVKLSEEKDKHGIPLPQIQWSISDRSIESFKTISREIKIAFENQGLGKIHFDDWFENDNKVIKDHLSDSYHHMGTTRMSNNIEEGVVDKECCVHGTTNLFIAGSSVFPTSGHSNPTLTILALALRLGRHIKHLNEGNNITKKIEAGIKVPFGK